LTWQTTGLENIAVGQVRQISIPAGCKRPGEAPIAQLRPMRRRGSELLISPRNFSLAGKMGGAIPFDGESFAGGAGGARLPARTESGPLFE
jgi:hypothetical protein